MLGCGGSCSSRRWSWGWRRLRVSLGGGGLLDLMLGLWGREGLGVVGGTGILGSGDLRALGGGGRGAGWGGIGDGECVGLVSRGEGLVYAVFEGGWLGDWGGRWCFGGLAAASTATGAGTGFGSCVGVG